MTTTPATPTCKTCRHYSALKPGWAAICFQRWKGLPWNAAVPLTSADEWCPEYEFKPPSSIENTGEK